MHTITKAGLKKSSVDQHSAYHIKALGGPLYDKEGMKAIKSSVWTKQ